MVGYLTGFLAPLIEEVPASRPYFWALWFWLPLPNYCLFTDPVVNTAMGYVETQSQRQRNSHPILMGFLLGGIIKMICTSPLSSMALTAMLGLTGPSHGYCSHCLLRRILPQWSLIFARLHLGNKSNIAAVMLEPLTQAHIITRHPIPIYGSNFFGGGLAGIAAAMLGIINRTPS